MKPLRQFFSASGRIAPRPFGAAAVAVYVLSFLSLMLISPPVTTRWGVWTFALAQALLTWIWLALHIGRLRDAGQPAGIAFAIALLYALAIVLLMLLIELITGSEPSAVSAEPGVPSFRDLWAVLPLFGVLATGEAGIFPVLALIMLMLILVPIALAASFSIWAATRPTMTATAANS